MDKHRIDKVLASRVPGNRAAKTKEQGRCDAICRARLATRLRNRYRLISSRATCAARRAAACKFILLRRINDRSRRIDDHAGAIGGLSCFHAGLHVTALGANARHQQRHIACELAHARKLRGYVAPTTKPSWPFDSSRAPSVRGVRIAARLQHRASAGRRRRHCWYDIEETHRGRRKQDTARSNRIRDTATASRHARRSVRTLHARNAVPSTPYRRAWRRESPESPDGSRGCRRSGVATRLPLAADAK